MSLLDKNSVTQAFQLTVGLYSCGQQQEQCQPKISPHPGTNRHVVSPKKKQSDVTACG